MGKLGLASGDDGMVEWICHTTGAISVKNKMSVHGLGGNNGTHTYDTLGVLGYHCRAVLHDDVEK